MFYICEKCYPNGAGRCEITSVSVVTSQPTQLNVNVVTGTVEELPQATVITGEALAELGQFIAVFYGKPVCT